MWRRPVCVGGIVCYAGFISVLPFFRDNVKNILEGNALNVFFFVFFVMTPSDENFFFFKKRRRVACTFTLPVRGHRLASEKMKKRRVAKIDREVALNLFSIFTVYNIFFNVIYIVNFCSYMSARLQWHWLRVCTLQKTRPFYENRVNTDKVFDCLNKCLRFFGEETSRGPLVAAPVRGGAKKGKGRNGMERKR